MATEARRFMARPVIATPFALSHGLPLRSQWGVLAVLVDLPCTSGPMAVALHRDRTTNQSESREHCTPAELLVSLLALLMHWFPYRNFDFAGDNAYGLHAMARFACRHRRRITLVSNIVPVKVCYVRHHAAVARRLAALRSRVNHQPHRVTWSFRRSVARR